MKTAAEVASHPKARLHRELILLLRARSSVEGAELAWREMRLNARLWSRAVRFGFGIPLRQSQLNTVAFPEHNRTEVDAALKAGNNLRGLYDLACGRAWIARDAEARYKPGRKGLKIIRQLRGPSCRSSPIQ
jgi:hypothetical protein